MWVLKSSNSSKFDNHIISRIIWMFLSLSIFFGDDLTKMKIIDFFKQSKSLKKKSPAALCFFFLFSFFWIKLFIFYISSLAFLKLSYQFIILSVLKCILFIFRLISMSLRFYLLAWSSGTLCCCLCGEFCWKS